MNTPEFPSELKALQHLADTQPELVKELYHWALAMVMVERGKIQIVEQHTADGRGADGDETRRERYGIE
jgi:hypothetical protein